jgi:hypothetical protein
MNPFKKKKEKFPTQAVPRSADEIKAAYFELRSRAGEAQYHVSVLNKELKGLNEAMESLNHEMAARQQLDAQTAKSAAEVVAVAPETKA